MRTRGQVEARLRRDRWPSAARSGLPLGRGLLELPRASGAPRGSGWGPKTCVSKRHPAWLCWPGQSGSGPPQSPWPWDSSPPAEPMGLGTARGPESESCPSQACHRHQGGGGGAPFYVLFKAPPPGGGAASNLKRAVWLSLMRRPGKGLSLALQPSWFIRGQLSPRRGPSPWVQPAVHLFRARDTGRTPNRLRPFLGDTHAGRRSPPPARPDHSPHGADVPSATVP